MQDPEIALKHANVISHACKLSGLLLASMLIREILCGCVWLLCAFSQFMDDEFETFVFAANCGVEKIIVLPELDIRLLMTTKSVTALMFLRAYKCAVFLPYNSDRCRSALGRSTHLHCFLKKDFSTLTSFLFNTHT